MKTRIISAIVGIAIALATLYAGEFFPIVISIVIALITTDMVGEYLEAKKLLKNYKISIPCMAFALSMPIVANYSLHFLPIYLFCILMFFIMIRNHETVTFNDIAFSFTGTIIIVLSMTCISILGNSLTYPSFFIILCLGIPWMADAGAFFVGTFLGKHKLCPKISPKKTVEGAIGGVVFGIIGGVLSALVFSSFIYKNTTVNYPVLIALSLVVAVISILGDLSFSLIKRSCKLKDFGSIMPGHGGFLDRFDSVIFSAPLILIVCQHIKILF